MACPVVQECDRECQANEAIDYVSVKEVIPDEVLIDDLTPIICPHLSATKFEVVNEDG